MRDDRTRRATEVSQPPIVVACVAEDLVFMPTARRSVREAIIRTPQSRGSRGVQRRVTPRQACPRPNGFGRNLRSKTRWFTGFCNSHQVSHFATFFIDARAEISVAESRFDIFEDDDAARAHRFRCNGDALSHSGFDNDPSAGSPTETLLRLLLPLNDKVQWTSRDVAGSEPPTSPRSEHFTGPFNRQIAPPTKNGHAPPPIESRKSSQSVNPYYVWTWINQVAFLSDIGPCKTNDLAGRELAAGTTVVRVERKRFKLDDRSPKTPRPLNAPHPRSQAETCGPSQSHDESWVDRDTSTATTSSCCPRRARGGKGQREAPFLNNR
ncbi:hypothetical protein ACE6H2_022673 [Prunus campanulata]